MFSLLDEPWIKCVDIDGKQLTVGIKNVFDGSQNIYRIQGDSPAQNYALTRLLLAVFWRAHHPETEVRPGSTYEHRKWFEETREDLRRAGRDEAVLEYLRQFESRFHLLDVKHPFMQVADLHTSEGVIKPVTLIVPEIKDDYFSMRAGSERDSLSFDEAARWLVYLQAYDYRGVKTGAVGDPRVKKGKGYPNQPAWTGMTGGTLVIGRDLLETLVLNTPQEALINPNDKPVWERNPDGPGERSTVGEPKEPQGAADLATWQSRRVRLYFEGDRVTGVLVALGDLTPDKGKNVFGDPMTPYRYSPAQSKKGQDIYYPRPYDVERTIWRAFDALVVTATDGGFSTKAKAPKRPLNLSSLATLARQVEGIPKVLNVELVSIAYGSNQSSVATTYSSTISMPTILLLQESRHLRNKVRAAVTATTQAALALEKFEGNLLIAAGLCPKDDDGRLKSKENDHIPKGTPTDRLLTELEPHFNHWLRQLASLTPEEASTDSNRLEELEASWQSTVRSKVEDEARIALRGAGPRALVGKLVKASKESPKELVSAAEYYQRLLLDLDEHLPKTARNKTMNHENTEESA
ncbi:type I-E CRISPR-associated protein Cse1/CasA [Trueperella bialowiezensis]|uniref:CRISPR type I-E/ECOLI-associated protein CasA/Cse1 n=1 Tax=Trueperella bialowiezensis TaxID=312285 RepID=A0A448PEW1_9ACTO|nr:type I-E CRISPR-associated protein Cse1/CasA [Trueperella bialowiezensis]VEI13473.1 CRISPR type I-E/ECOLI-associated protein CasA/Cse1 [Trueperella bialowiezensis]